MPFRDDLLDPIPGANPGGASLRYAPVYDQIKEARREEDEIPQGDWRHERKKADWPLVVKLAGEALAKKSKDLQIAAWLTEALLRREGFSGLKDGLDLMHGLLDRFWDGVYPEIEDGDTEMRATPVEWVGSRLDEPLKRVALTRSGLDFFKYKESRAVGYETDTARAEARAQAIEEGKLTAEEFDAAFDETPKSWYGERMEQVESCLASLDALNQICEEKFDGESPNLGGLRKSLEDVKQAVHVLLAKKRQQDPVVEPEHEATEQAALETQAESGWDAAAAPARAKAAQATEPVDRDDAISRVLAVAHWLRQNDPYSPVSYLLVRAVRWGELRGGGSEPDLSLLDPPATETRQQIKRLVNDGAWQEALEAAETAAGQPCGRAWLDIHRYAAQACEQMGYSAAAAAIRAELAAVLADVPRLPDMSLSDDTPAANADTRAWLSEQIAAKPSQAAEYVDTPAVVVAEAAPGEGRPPDPFDLAREALQNGNQQAAIQLLAREVAQERSGRGKFVRKVQLAQICMSARQPAMALPILESLAESVDQHKLEDWESADMVAAALVLLYRCMQALEASAEQRQKIYERICRLDPLQALSLSR